MPEPLWYKQEGEGPLVAAAIHDGHEVRQEVAQVLAPDEADRLREEDPYTGIWTAVAPTRIVVRTSRFEVDLNRLRDKAVYTEPEDAWGIQLWKRKPTAELVARSLAIYDAFYREVDALFRGLESRYGRFVVLDLHSYNHRRSGPDGPPADPEQNAEVDVATGSMDRERWAPVVDRFISDLARFDFLGRRLDVRENVKFLGGHFSRWIHETFPQSACVLSVEFKKFFMDEWSGEADHAQVSGILCAMRSSVSGILEELKRP